MTELLTSVSAIIKGFIDIFVIGLVNFDNPLLSLIDYMLWASLAIKLITKRKKR